MSEKPTAPKRKRRWLLLLLVLYAAAYFGLSRAGFGRADALDAEGFYLVEPTDAYRESANQVCVIFFYPLILVDRAIGTGRVPASVPIRRLTWTGTPNGGRADGWNEFTESDAIQLENTFSVFSVCRSRVRVDS